MMHAIRGYSARTIKHVAAGFFPKTLMVPLACLVLGACATNSVVRTTPLESLAVSGGTPDAANHVLNRYDRLILDPVDITVVANGHWQGVSERQRAEAVKLVHDRFATVVAKDVETRVAGSDKILRLHLTVEDVKLSSPVWAAVSHLLPVGFVINAGKSAVGVPAAKNMGSVTIAGELRDARNNALVASFWTQQGPDPMNLDAVIDQDSAMKAAIALTADRFYAALLKARKGEPVCGSKGLQTKTCHFEQEAIPVHG